MVVGLKINGPDQLVHNGIDLSIKAINQGMGELNFEEEEEDQFYMKDLPKHACAWVFSCIIVIRVLRGKLQEQLHLALMQFRNRSIINYFITGNSCMYVLVLNLDVFCFSCTFSFYLYVAFIERSGSLGNGRWSIHVSSTMLSNYFWTEYELKHHNILKSEFVSLDDSKKIYQILTLARLDQHKT